MNKTIIKKKVALAFFGITRSLKYTVDSINKQIIDVLKNNNMEVDIFLHTYKLTTNYINKRSKEKKNFNDIDNEEYKLLNPDYKQIDIQEQIINNLYLKQYRTHKDPWYTDYNSVDNYILGCYSKKQLVNLITKSKNHYDYVIFLRPDCLYEKKIDINFFKKVNDTTMCFPDFHLFGTYKVNDRFGICNMNNYQIYGNIFDSLLILSKQMPLHSETILGLIIKNNNIKIEKIKFRFKRVRCNGNIIDSNI